MTATWITTISERKWRTVRRELEDNGLILPFTSGVSHNRKTGYTITNNYYVNTSQLVIRVFYPGKIEDTKQLDSLFNNLFDSTGSLLVL